jgi:hypothetical protein
MRLVWHYTNGLVIEDILKDGVIKLATAGIKPPERPAAHFSTNPHWDHSADRGNVSLKKNDYPIGPFEADPARDFEFREFDAEWMDKNMGRYRIGVLPEAAPHGWRSYVKLARVPPEIAASLEKGSPKLGNPDEWRHSLQPVPRKLWRTVEKLEHGVWVTHVELFGGARGESNEAGRWGRS